VRVTVFVFAFVEFAVDLAMFAFVSASDATYKKKPTSPPPQTRTRIASIPSTQTQVFEDFFGVDVERTGWSRESHVVGTTG
jgi:hypothetical protein